MKLLDILLAANVCALFLGNLARFVSGIFFFPFVHLALSVLLLYICLSILFDRHTFGSHLLDRRALGSHAAQGERYMLKQREKKTARIGSGNALFRRRCHRSLLTELCAHPTRAYLHYHPDRALYLSCVAPC